MSVQPVLTCERARATPPRVQPRPPGRPTNRAVRMAQSSVLIATIALLVTGCATDRVARDADRLALYEANAGAPVQSVSYFGSLNGWTPLGDTAIALWMRPSQAYLVTFVGGCPDIDFANAIQVTNQGGRVYARFDQVVPIDGSPSRSIPCRIAELRPLDVKAIRAGERGLREARAAERAAD